MVLSFQKRIIFNFLFQEVLLMRLLLLEDNTIFQYKVDNYYSGVNDGGVIWNDEELAITWPKLKLELSEKDKNLPKLNQLNLNTLW